MARTKWTGRKRKSSNDEIATIRQVLPFEEGDSETIMQLKRTPPMIQEISFANSLKTVTLRSAQNVQFVR